MFRDRVRASDLMQAAAQNLSDNDIHELAMYFSKQHPPRVHDAAPPKSNLVASGRQLAESGAGMDVAACFSCHGASGKGNSARFPSIAGQPKTFLIFRLHEFQARARKAPPAPGSMTAVSAALNDTQIKQAATYLSTLEP
ncbi:MAG: cytochrome [Burkholderia sp.]|nr:cytochrome [Burkholderia sp.]